jgi:hypothetical protein
MTPEREAQLRAWVAKAHPFQDSLDAEVVGEIIALVDSLRSEVERLGRERDEALTVLVGNVGTWSHDTIRAGGVEAIRAYGKAHRELMAEEAAANDAALAAARALTHSQAMKVEEAVRDLCVTHALQAWRDAMNDGNQGDTRFRLRGLATLAQHTDLSTLVSTILGTPSEVGRVPMMATDGRGRSKRPSTQRQRPSGSSPSWGRHGGERDPPPLAPRRRAVVRRRPRDGGARVPPRQRRSEAGVKYEDQIRGFCRSNLDSAKRETWPTRFTRAPLVGETVKSRDGRSLRVCAVTHAEDETGPFVEIELHLLVGDTLENDMRRGPR